MKCEFCGIPLQRQYGEGKYLACDCRGARIAWWRRELQSKGHKALAFGVRELFRSGMDRDTLADVVAELVWGLTPKLEYGKYSAPLSLNLGWLAEEIVALEDEPCVTPKPQQST